MDFKFTITGLSTVGKDILVQLAGEHGNASLKVPTEIGRELHIGQPFDLSQPRN